MQSRLASMDPKAVKAAVAAIRAKYRREFTLENECFDIQAGALMAPGLSKVFVCSRRAGKSRGFAPGIMDAVTTPPFTNVFYMAPTFKRSKRILWSALKDINRRYGLGGIANETEAMLTFPKLGPDVHVYLAGLKDRGEADKIRGIPGKLWVGDEFQDVREDVAEYSMREVIQPGILDNLGEAKLWIGGTPGPVRAGYFYDVSEGSRRAEFEQHHWTWRDNPLLPLRKSGITNEEIEERILREFGLTREDATWLREWCGLWVEDLNALVFQPAETCEWQTGPQRGWEYISCFDIGANDSDVVSILGWPKHSRVVDLVAEDVKADQDVTDLGGKLETAMNKWRPSRLVGDLGALGKKIGLELVRRHGIPVEAADKHRKLEHIALLNAAIRKREFRAPADSVYAKDAKKLSWDLEARAKNEKKISSRYHSDACDAVLYGFRHAQAFMEEPPPEAQTFEQIENKWLEQMEREALQQSQADASDDYGDFREMGYE